jgi:hypothetical protein
MSFSSDISNWSAKVQANGQKVFLNTASHAFESIVNGSSVTGAPGQPVDTGALRNSWQLTFPSPTEALIATNLDYAVHVEENVRGVTFHNHGPHSVRLTALGLNRIVEAETKKVVG